MPEDRVHNDLTRDAFLGGRLHLWQPRQGYRAGVDPVLLAASLPVKAGEQVLELGCGAGAALLCLGARVPHVGLTGLELQSAYADLARRNAQANALAADILTGDLARMPAELRDRSFDHVMANPPYFDRSAGKSATDPGRETALGEQTPLDLWVKTAAKRTVPGGYVTFIQRVERLPELITAMSHHLGSLQLLPLIPRPERSARLVLIRGRKGGRAAFRLHDGFVLHAGIAHPGDRENYTPATACILRQGGALPFPA